MARKKYSAAPGAQFSHADAKKYGPAVQKAMESNGGILKPEDLVLAARNTRNPLNRYFEWSNRKAADKFRISQARHLINHLCVEVIVKGKRVTRRDNISVLLTPDMKNKNRVYVDLKAVSENPNFKQQMIEYALKELEIWQQRYRECTDLKKINYVIDRTRQTFHMKRSKKSKPKTKKRKRA